MIKKILSPVQYEWLKQFYFYFERRLLPSRPLPGCAFFGTPTSENGLGQHLRYVVESFSNFSIIDTSFFQDANTRENEYSAYITKESDFRCNIICDSYKCFYSLYQNFRKNLRRGYNIFYGYWELNDLPEEFMAKSHLLDEIWAPTRYIQETFSKMPLPVIHMPIPIHFAQPASDLRKELGIENRFCFLFTFDFSSVSKRKNPWAVLEAFKRAFSEKDNALLIIKAIPPFKRNREENENCAKLKEMIDSRMLLIMENYEQPQMRRLLATADCYVSLHRAEGFGLGLAESMLLGKPVIATNFSGNCDFMNAENSCLVNFSLKKVESGDYFHLEGNSVWADPDIEHAVYYMRKVYTDEAFRKKIGGQAARYIRENHNPQTIGRRYQERLKQLNLI